MFLWLQNFYLLFKTCGAFKLVNLQVRLVCATYILSMMMKVCLWLWQNYNLSDCTLLPGLLLLLSFSKNHIFLLKSHHNNLRDFKSQNLNQLSFSFCHVWWHFNLMFLSCNKIVCYWSQIVAQISLYTLYKGLYCPLWILALAML